MKYKPEYYLDSGFYSDMDDEIENKTERIVKCRRPHKCMGGCDKEIPRGEHALLETGFLDGKPVLAYTCLPCIEAWLVESGQVEVDENGKEIEDVEG